MSTFTDEHSRTWRVMSPGGVCGDMTAELVTNPSPYTSTSNFTDEHGRRWMVTSSSGGATGHMTARCV